MSVATVRSRPPGIVTVVLLTGLYSVVRLLPSLSLAGVAGFAVAYLLWRGFLVGWIAAVLLYTLLVLDFALGIAVFGLTQLPYAIVSFIALAYLLSVHEQFQTVPSSSDVSETDPAQTNCSSCGARNAVTNEECYYCDDPL